MESKVLTYRLMLSACLILIVWIVFVDITENNSSSKQKEIDTCNVDSLVARINQLENEIKIDEDGWDKKEQRYEDILFEYEYGINHLKESHPDAYREFHRIIGYKERYSRELEKENNNRLKIPSGK